MFVDVHCKKCDARKRLDVGHPRPEQSVQEHVHLLTERLSHQPSFQCFGGHFELSAPLPRFWEIEWDTLADT